MSAWFQATRSNKQTEFLPSVKQVYSWIETIGKVMVLSYEGQPHFTRYETDFYRPMPIIIRSMHYSYIH